MPEDLQPDSPFDSKTGYSLEQTPQPPALPGQVMVGMDTEDAHGKLATDLMLHAKNCVRSFGDFHLSLSGGSTPMPLYRRLMVDPNYRDFPWKKTHLWIVDERIVPEDDDRFNYKHIHELIVSHSDIPKSQVHPIRATADHADQLYERELKEHLGWREKGHDRLDFVLLGMGDDGHTASLFPGSPALDDQGRFVLKNSGPTVTPPDRITMTYTLINGARFVAVLVTGEKKRDTLLQVASHRGDTSMLPITGIQPVGGSLRWYLDAAACPE